MEISGQTRLAGLFANPARHSLSPLMQTTAFQENQINAVYLSFEITPAQLEQAMEGIRTFDLIGVNLSMPYKELALAYLDELDPTANLIGAVNTIVNREDKLIGYNTDGIGFMRSMQENDVTLTGKELTILGAGGAAQAIMVQAAVDGVKKIHLFNRKSPTYDKIKRKIEQLNSLTDCVIELHDLADQNQLRNSLATSALLVNATSIGMTDTNTPIAASLLYQELPVADLIYQPQETELLRLARINGAKTINGLGMLIHQGAAAFELWTGKPMPLELVRQTLNKQLNHH